MAKPSREVRFTERLSDLSFIQWSNDSTHVFCAVQCCCFFSFKCKTSEIPSGYQKRLKVQTKNIQKNIFLCLVAPLSLLSPLPSWPLITKHHDWPTETLVIFWPEIIPFPSSQKPGCHLLLCLLLNLSKLFSQIFKFPPVQKPRLLAGGSRFHSRQIFPTSIPLAS